MEKNLPVLSRGRRAPGRSDASSASDFSLLLVSRSPAWCAAVTSATESLGHVDVLTCGVRDALALMAGMASRYSHLLIDQNDADGLLDELADLATEMAAPDMDLLVLGAADSRYPQIRFVPTATPRSILEALMVTNPPRGPTVMDLAELRAALAGAMVETRYQPIIRVGDRHPVGLEALVRLNHPEKGTILPDCSCRRSSMPASHRN